MATVSVKGLKLSLVTVTDWSNACCRSGDEQTQYSTPGLHLSHDLAYSLCDSWTSWRWWRLYQYWALRDALLMVNSITAAAAAAHWLVTYSLPIRSACWSLCQVVF